MSKNEHISLVKEENLHSTEARSLWQEIDGWEDSTHTVRILWRVVDGENQFNLDLEPKTGNNSTAVDVSFDEVQQIRHEQHAYPFVAPKAGHLATVNALGIPEAA
jgi:hypothetical protein